jgi:hypothetical protein
VKRRNPTRDMTFSREYAGRLIPILKWIAKDYPRDRVKDQAKIILKEIQGIEKGWRVVYLTRSEEELVSIVNKAFPDGVMPEGQQLELFSKYSAILPRG